MMHTSGRTDISETLRDMAPHAARLLLELHIEKRYDDLPTLFAFIDLMRRWGADPDPDGTLRVMVGSMAGGTRVPIEEAIRVRSMFQENDHLDLRGLAVSDHALAAIPETVTMLSLEDTGVSDAGIEHVLRLRHLLQPPLLWSGMPGNRWCRS